MRSLTPRQIVAELDRYIVGQAAAKRAVAVAIRNRWRRQQLGREMREEVAPKNIIMIGPTGVGKTEIARRLAALVNAPFLKVEASRYTEVGYVGRDVESMVRDLTELAINMVRSRELEAVRAKAEQLAEERLLDILLPAPRSTAPDQDEAPSLATRERLRERLRGGSVDERVVEIAVEERPVPIQVFSALGTEQMDFDFQNIFERILPSRSKERKVKVGEARGILAQQEAEKLIDRERISREGVELAENSGIIFVDEIDKVAGRERGVGPDVSREGVQRDLLPILEGTTVATRHGMVKSHHVLFIAAGAFHVSKPSDLIPELQGRFPLRVELSDLGKDEFARILTEPENALTKQYAALLGTEGIELAFSPDAIEEIAATAASINERVQSIGARRLYTVMEKVLEEASFEAPDGLSGRLVIDGEYVRGRLKGIIKDEDLTRYIL